MKKLTTEEFIHKANQIHNFKYNYSLVEYIDILTNVTIICKDHGIFLQIPSSHFQGHGCPKCANIISKNKQIHNQNEIISKLIIKYNNQYDYSKMNYIGSKNKVIIICNILDKNNQKHGEFEITTDSLLHGHGCPKCKIQKLKSLFTETFENFCNECNKIHNFEYEYFKENYKNSKSIIKVKHKKCQNFFNQRVSSHKNGHGCPFCHKNNYSHGEIQIEKYLKINNIFYKTEFLFNDCRGKKRPLPFDFYLPKQNICIEFDGKHHYKKGKFVNANVQINDKIKDEYCKQNNIRLLRIPYWKRQNISQILNSILY